jgi:methylamine dehydrogenase accessory protein MauD
VTSLLIAHASLWLLIAGMVVLLVLLSRQIGALHRRVAPAGALAVNELLEVGLQAPELSVTTLDGREVAVGGRRPKSQLLLFIAPDCPISRSLVPVLGSLPYSERWLEVLLLSDGQNVSEHEVFAAQKDLSRLNYGLSEAAGRAYGVSKLPYAVLIDANGLVAGMGIVNSREHLESLFEAKERGVASIQDYMAGNGQFYPMDSEPADGRSGR